MKIKVTKEHISKGQPSSASFCPVALAFRDLGYDAMVTGSEVHIYVSPNDGPYGWIDSSGRWGDRTSLRLPRDVYDFIIAFDSGNLVEPFEFELGPEAL